MLGNEWNLDTSAWEYYNIAVFFRLLFIKINLKKNFKYKPVNFSKIAPQRVPSTFGFELIKKLFY